MKLNSIWINLLDENIKYYNIKQNINDLKTLFKIQDINSNINKTINETMNKTINENKLNKYRHTLKNLKKSKTYIKTIKSKREKSKKIAKTLSKIIDTLYQK